MACIRNEKTTQLLLLTFPFGSTNCIRFKGYFSAQGTPKVFCKRIVFLINKEIFIFFRVLIPDNLLTSDIHFNVTLRLQTSDV